MEHKYYLYLSQVKYLGWRRLELLIKYFGSVEKVWRSEGKKWLELGVDKEIVRSFLQVRDKINQGIDLETEMRKEGVIFVDYQSERYPSRLRNIASPPIGIYCKGKVELLDHDKVIAVVGTRRASFYGRRMARIFVEGLVKEDYVIVSGLATGIDGEAHRVCLAYEGRTVAVLAHGLEMVYPSENEELAKDILRKGGLIVSEYPIGVRPERRQFIARNRIVTGISDKLLVIEAPIKSGTKVSAGFAAEQGKEVYVVPGPIDYPGYQGSVEIIRDGGIPVYKVTDIID